MAQRGAQGPRQRGGREAALRAVKALSTRDQIEVTLTLIKYLGGEVGTESVAELQVQRRAAALRDLERSAQALGLAAGEAPTVHRHDSQASALGLMSSQQIVRAFGRWSSAKRALRGERLPETPEQRALRATTGGKKRSHEDYLVGVRLWLDSAPQATTQTNYDAFVRANNENRREDEPPLVRGSAIIVALGLAWEQVLAIGRGKMELNKAIAARRERIRREAGSIGLVGSAATALLLGQVTTATPWL